ncbi:hypothetical protein KS4_33330 [Poriferisphaera corsica]|uniref:Uncharacterized protein n=1 Tax=Poriferisphaera corsica TaxID=2528020 RepID=A0A517YYE5_9BACT|nr:hypothetical protein KS4_33330 [Poriferisphaera corsica]
MGTWDGVSGWDGANSERNGLSWVVFGQARASLS